MSLRIPAKKIVRRELGKIRLANAPFLNSVPYSLAKDLSWIDYQEVLPAECGRKLFEDEVDVSLIPLAEWFSCGRDDEFELLPLGIAAENPVTSVIFFSENPIEDIDTVYVDSASRSSIALLRILFQRRGRPWRNVRYHRTPAETARQRISGATGALLIGDPARAARGRYPFELDLAEAWREETGLPMVFAVWAARKDVLSPEQKAELLKTFQSGLDSRGILARDWAERTSSAGISSGPSAMTAGTSSGSSSNESERASAEEYVQSHIHYRLDERSVQGAETYRSLGIDCGLFPVHAPRAQFLSAALGTTRGTQAETSIDAILALAANGERISVEDALRLAAEASLADLALAADERREHAIKNRQVSYIIDRNINYTNVCNVFCRFCAFYRAPGRAGGYVLSKEEIGKKIEEMMEAGGIQILLQGGLHPELGIEYYEDLFRWIKANYPINLHALSADEIIHITRVSGISIEETLQRLIQAGLGSFPGGGAEILVDRVRNRIARLKSTTEEWLEVHRTAHRLGLRSTCTMMFGVQETWEDRVLHLQKLRALQDDTGGFTAFITWPFQDDNLKLERGDTSASEYLRVQSICRLFLDNIAHVQSSWVTMGPSIGQVALDFGADDFGSVMFEENVVSSAGTTYCLDTALIERHIREAGFHPWRRNIHYKDVTPGKAESELVSPQGLPTLGTCT